MHRTRRRGTGMLLLMITMLPSLLHAQQPPADAAPPLWWLRNARTAPLHPQLLVHAEGQYAFARVTGNMTGKQHDGGVALTLRKGSITSGTSATIRKQDAEIAGGRGRIEHEALGFDQYFRYDLNRYLGPQVGYGYSRDDSRYIDSRQIVYAGMNVNPVTTAAIQTRILFAAGSEQEEFTVPEPARDALHGYLGSEVQWTVHPRLRLSEVSTWLFKFEENDDYRWTLNLGADITVTRYFGISLQHSVNYDNQPVPSIAASRDSQQSIMLRLMY